MRVVRLAERAAVASNHDPIETIAVHRIWTPGDLTPVETGRMPFANWAVLPAGKAFSPHHHGDKELVEDPTIGMSEFFVIVSGRGTFTGGDETEDVATGDLIYIPRGEVHSLKNPSDIDPLIYICWGISTVGGTFIMPH